MNLHELFVFSTTPDHEEKLQILTRIQDRVVTLAQHLATMGDLSKSRVLRIKAKVILDEMCT